MSPARYSRPTECPFFHHAPMSSSAGSPDSAEINQIRQCDRPTPPSSATAINPATSRSVRVPATRSTRSSSGRAGLGHTRSRLPLIAPLSRRSPPACARPAGSGPAPCSSSCAGVASSRRGTAGRSFAAYSCALQGRQVRCAAAGFEPATGTLCQAELRDQIAAGFEPAASRALVQAELRRAWVGDGTRTCISGRRPVLCRALPALDAPVARPIELRPHEYYAKPCRMSTPCGTIGARRAAGCVARPPCRKPRHRRPPT